MGKSKGSQRTKGNAKPSSSGHTAELIGSSSTSGFVGFGNSKVGQHVAHADSNLDGNFTMVMKKMIKRDVTTKLKAVQEFGELCSEKEKEEVLSALAFWPRLYNRLSLDIDRRIREATQETHAKMLAKVSREVAPYLKNMMGVWLLAQNDLYLSAASIARSTFASTFPTDKQSDALMFCKDEIIAYFKDNLFEQTLQSLSEPHIPKEEVEQKYALLVAGSLQGLKLFLSTVVPDARSKLMEDFKTIVDNPKFWKLAKNKNSHICVAWYNLISTLCHNMPEVFLTFEGKLGCLVLGRLSESDLKIAPAIWETALHFVASFENCWGNIDVHKVVLPELWSLLRQGGLGNAALLYPCLLPLLSKLPIDAMANQNKFYTDFFTALTDSLFLDNVVKSIVECNAIVSAYMECLQYVCFHCKKNDQLKALVKTLIVSQLIELLGKTFTQKGTHIAVSHFYTLLGTFLQNLTFTDSNKDSHICNKEFYKEETQTLWTNIFRISELVINGDHSQHTLDLALLAFFYNCLFHRHEYLKMPKTVKAKLLDFESSKRVACNEKPKCDQPELISCYTRVCLITCRKLSDNLEKFNLKLFLELVAVSPTCELFHELSKKLKSSNHPVEESPYAFVEHVVLPWLQNENDMSEMLSYIADIIFLACSCLDSDLAAKLLNHCCQVDNFPFLEQILFRVMSSNVESGLKEYPGTHKFMKSSELSSTIIRIFRFVADMLLSEQHQDSFSSLECYISTLKIYLQPSCSKDFCINMLDVKELLSIALSSLKAVAKTSSQLNIMDVTISKFMCDITEILFTRCDECWKAPIANDLMMTFLELILLNVFCGDIQVKLHQMWTTFVQKLAVVQYDFSDDSKFFDSIALKFHDCIVHPSDKMSSHSVVECIGELFIMVENVFSVSEIANSNKLSCKIIPLLMVKILPSENKWTEMRQNFEIDAISQFIDRKLVYPLPEQMLSYERNKNLPVHIFAAQNVSDILMNCINSEETAFAIDIIADVVRQQIPHLLWALSFYDASGFLSNKDFEQYTDALSLQKKCFQILSFLSQSEAVTLLHNMCSKSVADFKQWLLPFVNAVEIIKSQHIIDSSILCEIYLELSDSKESSKQLTCQALISHLPEDARKDICQAQMLQFSKDAQENGELNLKALAEVCCCLQHNDVGMSNENNIVLLLKHALKLISTAKLSSEMEFGARVLIHGVINEVTRNIKSFISLLPEILDYSWKSLALCSEGSMCTNSQEFLHTYHCCTMICALLSQITEEGLIQGDSHKRLVEYFLNDITTNLMSIFLSVYGFVNTKEEIPNIMARFLFTLSAAFEFLPARKILKYISSDSSGALDVANGEFLNSTLETKLLPILQSRIAPLQLCTHSILSKIMQLLPEFLRNNEDDKSESSDSDEITIKLISMVDFLQSCTEVVENMLSHLKLYEFCVVVPNTDSYTYTMAFLFAWVEFLDLFAASTNQERSDYVTYLEKKHLLSLFLSCLFRLLPENPAEIWPNENGSKAKDFKHIFSQVPSISPLGLPKTADLQHLACYTFYNTLMKIPAVVRTWYHGLDKKSSDTVNKFTCKYVSSLLAAKELKSVHEQNLQVSNMTVQALPSTREVIATYTVEGYGIELMIQLPSNYPLGPLTIEKHGNVRLNQLKWRQWLMQLTSFLTYQNGSILDGLMLWKRNVDKTFEGLEECVICYFILHSSTYELPKQSCRTCKKKFHSYCIHKWFVTSNNSACPYCRNLW